MATEIERKFLVCNDSWRGKCSGKVNLRQGYITASAECTVRVRVSDSKAWLTVKGPSRNISRSEFEYLIPGEDAEKILSELALNGIIEKTRYFLNCNGREWIIDEFAGDNRGLILVEIELSSEDEKFDKPDWLGKEVSKDYRYCSSNLSRNPYVNWKEENRIFNEGNCNEQGVL